MTEEVKETEYVRTEDQIKEAEDEEEEEDEPGEGDSIEVLPETCLNGNSVSMYRKKWVPEKPKAIKPQLPKEEFKKPILPKENKKTESHTEPPQAAEKKKGRGCLHGNVFENDS